MRWAFTTDAYVVQPLEFLGGDIGRLAVTGAASDLAIAGARPRPLSASFVLEEGLVPGSMPRRVVALDGGCRDGVWCGGPDRAYHQGY